MLFDRHFVGLRRFFANKVDRGIEDLVQSTLLRCVESKDAIVEPSRFRAYLYRVARNELFMRFRGLVREPGALDSQQACVESLSRSPSRIVARRIEHGVLLRALRRIPLDHQIALELYYWDGLKTAELGDVLGVPASTMTTRLARARQLLREQIAAMAGDGAPWGTTDAGLATWAAAVRAEVDPSA